MQVTDGERLWGEDDFIVGMAIVGMDAGPRGDATVFASNLAYLLKAEGELWAISESPRPSLWTRFWCATWWGHRPVSHNRPGLWARDELGCRCGKVRDTAENVAKFPRPW